MRGGIARMVYLCALVALCAPACDTGDGSGGAVDAGATDAGGSGTQGDSTAGSDLPAVGPLSDPLSMPAEPLWESADFASATECKGCHTTHYEEWSTSNHAYAMVDPVFRALVAVRQDDFGGEEDRFCTQCHTAIGTRAGECDPGFRFEDLSPRALEGVTCVACHQVTEVNRPYNSGHVLDPGAAMGGPLADPAGNDFHESRHAPFMEESRFCGGCHDVLETSGLNLERPYEEWLESPAAVSGQTCQGCHMPTYAGVAGAGAVAREGLHSHRFGGVALPLLEGFLPDEDTEAAIDADIDELLGSAAGLELAAPSAVGAGTQLDVLVTITNKIDGHYLPTGTTFMRQLWLELTATDSEGRVLYRTGDLDGDGDLRDHWSAEDPYGDADLITLTSSFVDQDGEPVLFPWRASEHLTRAVPPLYQRTYTLFVPVPDDVAGPIHIDARLRFRSVAPYLLRALGLTELVERLVIRELAADAVAVDVSGP